MCNLLAHSDNYSKNVEVFGNIAYIREILIKLTLKHSCWNSDLQITPMPK